MNIIREQVKQVFKEYTDLYDSKDEKIKLKIFHTYRVAAICERIAKSLSLSDEDVELAWLLGMLHDIGRFEQLKRYGTFSDAQSIDHAHFGAELLYGNEWKFDFREAFGSSGYLEGNFGSEMGGIHDVDQKIFLDRFVAISPCEEAFELIKTAIWNHSAYRIEESLSERMKMFCHILRDADKVDIFKVCQDTPLEVIYNVSTEDVKYSEVTDEVMKQFFEKHAILRSLKKTPADCLAGYAALAFELVYPESIKIAKEQGYLKKILEFPSKNERTVAQFHKMRGFMEENLGIL